MELNFSYKDGNYIRKVIFNATEVTDKTFLMSQVGGFSEGVKSVGWCPKPNNLNFRDTEPRYFGTSGNGSNLMGPGYTGDYSRFFPDDLVTAIKKYPTENTYTLTTSSNFLGTKPTGAQYYTGVPLLIEADSGYKKVCNLLWAYRPQAVPGQNIHSYIKTGFWGFSYPSDEFPDSVMYSPTSDRNEYQFTTEFPEIKMSLWIITVQDDVTGSVSYGKEFKLLAQVINDYVSFIDLRLLDGTYEGGKSIPNGSDTKKNSTPKGWSGTRSTASGRDFPTMCPNAVKNSVNFGDHGIFLYECEVSDIEQISGFLWDTDIILVNWEPIKGILAIHKLPYVPEHIDGSETSDKVNVNIAGKSVIANGLHYLLNPIIPEPGGDAGGIDWEMTHYEPMGWRLYGGQEKTSQPLQVQPFFGSFLDFEPYTKVQVRLPFIGTVSVPTSACMGGWIKVNYIFDNRNGNCVAQILCESMRNGENDDSDGYIIIGQYSGNCAIPAAITGNSTGGEARIGAVKGFASSAASIGTAVALGVAAPGAGAAALIGAGVKSTLDYSTAPKTPDIVGSVNCEAACLEDLAVKVIITRPVDVTPGDFQVIEGERVFTASSLMDQKGLASYAGGKVAQYEGMTIGYIRGTIEGASEAEMLEIRNMFLGGVIV